VLGFLGYLLALIVFGNLAVGAGLFVLSRHAVRAGRRLIGDARKRLELDGETQAPSREAEDVTVETVGERSRQSSGRRPKAPEGASAATPSDARDHHEYTRLDVDAGATNETISAVMRGYVNDPVLGRRARAVIETLGSAEHRRGILFAELDGTFQRGTISWDKFAGPAYAALDSVLRNSALLANRIQAFDSAGYLRLREDMAAEADGVDGEMHHSETRQRRWELYREMLESLDTLQDTNEGLLLELDKLAAELSTINGPGQGENSDQIIDEIRRLVDEAKYYRQIGQ
jgi:hypothetical protein